MKDLIFICYRRSDEPLAALVIELCLLEHFGSGQVFRDRRSILPGVHFPDRLVEALNACQALIAVIGPDWPGHGRDGKRRIDDPDDYVRREIATALRRGVLVVPVLVGGVPLPAAGTLPAEIAGLASRQYLWVGADTGDDDAARLASKLTRMLGGAEPQTAGPSPVTQPAAVAAVNNFHGAVDASHSIFGNVYHAGATYRALPCGHS